MKYALFLCLLFSSISQAEVVVRHPDIDEATYLKSFGAGSKSVVDHLEAKFPAPADEKRLLQKFERAQNLFLSSDVTAAKVAFIEITEEAFRADWTETQRKVISISFLRVAQLSSDPHAAQNYLVRAAQFAGDLAFDSSMFPPPLLNQYSEILAREKSKSLQVDLKDKFPQHDLIIIDGKRIRADQMHAHTVMPGRHRVTAISNSHQSFSQELTASQLDLIKADVPSYVIGTCEQPALSGYQSLGVEEVKVVFGSECVRSYTGTNWINASESSTALPTKFTHLPMRGFTSSSAPQPVLTKKKLVLIGLGVGVLVTSALLIKKSQQKREEIEPVSRQGF